MEIGADGINVKIRCFTSRIKNLGKKSSIYKNSECELKASMSAQLITFTIPDNNIIINMKIGDIVDAIAATNNKYKSMRNKDKISEFMGGNLRK
jgi:hypothetical protein